MRVYEAAPPWREQTDGRVARGDRTRRAIVDAHTSLLREGELRPTAQRIAERAGVSVRTLWASFGDMEGLLTATVEYWLAADDALRRPIDAEAPLVVRIDQYCEERARRLENISPAARAAQLGEPYSAALRASRRRHVERARDDAARVFAAELAAAADREAMIDQLAAATSWNTWSLLRDDFGRTETEATSVMRHTLTALLT